MKYIDEFRDPAKVKALLAEIGRVTTKPWVLMEICGGQTHAFLHHGLDQMLPAGSNSFMDRAARSALRRSNRSTRRWQSPRAPM
jgi:hypothetical protein